MRTATLPAAATLLAFAAALTPAVSAAPKPFTGPAGWDHAVVSTATADSPRSNETWKKSDGESIVLLGDGGLTYADQLALVTKNAATLKAAVNRDRTCAGQSAHEVEETFGTTIVHQILIDNSPGVTKITYTRPQTVQPAAEVTAALNAYCGS